MSSRNRFSIIIGVVFIAIGITSNKTFLAVGIAVIIIGIVRSLKEKKEADNSDTGGNKD